MVAYGLVFRINKTDLVKILFERYFRFVKLYLIAINSIKLYWLNKFIFIGFQYVYDICLRVSKKWHLLEKIINANLDFKLKLKRELRYLYLYAIHFSKQYKRVNYSQRKLRTTRINSICINFVFVDNFNWTRCTNAYARIIMNRKNTVTL